MVKIEKVICGDCLLEMKYIPNKSIDMILCDLPYGITGCIWDTIIPFDLLWEQYKRIIKNHGAIVLFGCQPFTSKLIMSNLSWFKYEWIWDKGNSGNFQLANKVPLRVHENIVVFAADKLLYKPQMIQKEIPIDKRRWKFEGPNMHFSSKTRDVSKRILTKSIIDMYCSVSGECNNPVRVHPTQKPVGLFEYLIQTYTNEGDLVLDNCAGSGTTGVSCKKLNRQFILIEKEQKYIDICNKRLSEIHYIDAKIIVERNNWW